MASKIKQYSYIQYAVVISNNLLDILQIFDNDYQVIILKGLHLAFDLLRSRSI